MSSNDRLAKLECKIQYLTDRQEILDCITRNSRGNDRFDTELVASSYHTDGFHEIGRNVIPGPKYGEHANHAHSAMCERNLHHVTMHSCEIDGDVAHAENYVIGLFLNKGTESSRILSGRYIDVSCARLRTAQGSGICPSIQVRKRRKYLRLYHRSGTRVRIRSIPEELDVVYGFVPTPLGFLGKRVKSRPIGR
jgi:SnoaL-like domain